MEGATISSLTYLVLITIARSKSATNSYCIVMISFNDTAIFTRKTLGVIFKIKISIMYLNVFSTVTRQSSVREYSII